MRYTEPKVTEDSSLYRIRHSLSHVLAQAVLELRPGSTLGFGPPIKHGFYYDFILTSPLTEEDFPDIERRMRKIIKQGKRFFREELSVNEALERIDQMGEPYKREYAEELVQKNHLEKISFYRSGPFIDMCDGPHVDTAKDIPASAFKLRSIAGAYWRGNSDNTMMTRIYAWAFADKDTLDEFLVAWEEAQSRDHKKLGRELDIFVIDNEVGRGLPLWLPNGVAIRDELEKLAEELEFKGFYQKVVTPHLAREALYRSSGHLPYYADNMYPKMTVYGDQGEAKESYVLKPMNCPHHHRIFAARPRSYRDLPLRLAEYGQVYRFEESGAVTGLVRTRAMCMNDAHIYCSEEQIEDEFQAVMEMYQEAYRIMGLKNYLVRLSGWDPGDSKGRSKYIDDPLAWVKSEETLGRVLDNMGINYQKAVGEAAFYGPKVDIQFFTTSGRDETVSTVQLDFSVPKRLGLVYTGSDGKEHTPYCIHRAPFSTHERMVAFLLEHFNGAFPTWLAPVQVQIISVSEKFSGYAEKLFQSLRADFIRVEIASDNETVSRKIKSGIIRKIPNLLVVGEKEEERGQVTLRRYGQQKQHTMAFDQFKAVLLEATKDRSDSHWDSIRSA